MAEEKKTASPRARSETKSETKPETAAPPRRSLQPASESSDPAVHQVLAQLQTARANGDDDETERLTKHLAELGYE